MNKRSVMAATAIQKFAGWLWVSVLFLVGFFIFLASTSHAVTVGDTYERVVKECGQPTGRMEDGAQQTLFYPKGSITLRDNVVVEMDLRLKEKAPKGTATGVPPNEAPARLPPLKSKEQVLEHYTIHTKLFEDPKSYFEGDLRQRALDVERKDRENKMTPEACVSCAAGTMGAFLYVPRSYDGKTPHGLYVDIRPGDRGGMMESYRPVLNAHQMLFVSPHGAGNETDTFRRLALALDSMASVMKDFSIDERRVIVGGCSGGGVTACECLMLYPEYFAGTVSHARHAALAERPAGDNKVYGSAFPYCTKADYQRVADLGRRWVFISGPNDFNYAHVKECLPQWQGMGFDAQFVDVLDMGHSDAPAGAFEQAITWILREK